MDVCKLIDNGDTDAALQQLCDAAGIVNRYKCKKCGHINTSVTDRVCAKCGIWTLIRVVKKDANTSDASRNTQTSGAEAETGWSKRATRDPNYSLPMLPKKAIIYTVMPDDYRYRHVYGYTSEQMKAYAKRAINQSNTSREAR